MISDNVTTSAAAPTASPMRTMTGRQRFEAEPSRESVKFIITEMMLHFSFCSNPAPAGREVATSAAATRRTLAGMPYFMALNSKHQKRFQFRNLRRNYCHFLPVTLRRRRMQTQRGRSPLGARCTWRSAAELKIDLEFTIASAQIDGCSRAISPGKCSAKCDSRSSVRGILAAASLRSEAGEKETRNWSERTASASGGVEKRASTSVRKANRAQSIPFA